MLKKMLFLASCIHSVAILCSADVFNPKEWKKVPAEKLSEKELDRLNWSSKEYAVKISDGVIHVSRPVKQTDNVKVLTRGRLVAADDGEFGGGLFQYFEKGNGSRKITDGNFRSFFDIQGKTYVLDGLAHLSINEGRVWNIYESNGIWHLGKSIDVGGSPYAYCLKNEKSIYLVTPETLLDVNLETSLVRPLIEKAFWVGLYPNSMAKESDSSLWVGMRGGILNVRIASTPKMYWYTKWK